MTHIHATREALIAARQWSALVQHALRHGQVKPGWLASAPLQELALTDHGAQLAALEGLDPQPLVALGADLARVRAVAEGYAAAGGPHTDDLCCVRVRALCTPRAAPQG